MSGHQFSERFERVMKVVFSQEGGFNRDDPSKFGITAETLSEWRGKPVSIADVKNLTKPEAKKIYKNMFWDRVGGDALSDHVALMVMDTAVLRGPTIANELLGRSIGISRNTSSQEFIDTFSLLRLNDLKSLDKFSQFGPQWTARVGRIRSKANNILTQPQKPVTPSSMLRPVPKPLQPIQ